MVIGHAPTYEDWAAGAGIAGRVVAYADKRARQDLVSLDERFAEWHQRYPDSPPLDLAHSRARRLERVVCALAGLRPSDVGRLAWVDEALPWPGLTWPISGALTRGRSSVPRATFGPRWRRPPASRSTSGARVATTMTAARDRPAGAVTGPSTRSPSHLSTSPMFSAGTLVIVRQPGSLVREAAARERLIGLATEVAPGNALCFLELLAAGGSGPAQQGALRDAVAAADGAVARVSGTRTRTHGGLDRQPRGASSRSASRRGRHGCSPSASAPTCAKATSTGGG